VFDTGAKVGPASQYPKPQEIVAVWDELSDMLMQRLGELTEADLACTAGAARCRRRTRRSVGRSGIFSLHEAYHVGQMGTCGNGSG
jgi:hypothetical protein